MQYDPEIMSVIAGYDKPEERDKDKHRHKHEDDEPEALPSISPSFNSWSVSHERINELLAFAVGQEVIDLANKSPKHQSYTSRLTERFCNQQFDDIHRLMDYRNRVAFVREWLREAVKNEHEWLDKKDASGRPTKLQGHLDKAVKDAYKWLMRQHSLGEKLPYDTERIANRVFGKPVFKPSHLYKVTINGHPDQVLSYRSEAKRNWSRHNDISIKDTVSKFVKNLGGKFDIKAHESYNGFRITLNNGAMSCPGGAVMAGEFDFNFQTRTVYTGGTATNAEAAGTYKTFFKNYLGVCETLGIEKINIWAGDVGAYAWLRYGYVPDQQSWNGESKYPKEPNLRRTLTKHYKKYRRDMSDETAKIIKAAIRSDDPKAAWLIADLREEIDGQPIGMLMFIRDDKGAAWRGSLDLTDPDCVNRAKAYITDAPAYIPAPPKTTVQKAADYLTPGLFDHLKMKP